MRNEEVLNAIANEVFQAEVGQFNIEFNAKPSSLEGRAAEDLETELRVEVEKAPGVKCERCWRYVPATHTEPDWAGICDRCVDALAEPVNR